MRKQKQNGAFVVRILSKVRNVKCCGTMETLEKPVIEPLASCDIMPHNTPPQGLKEEEHDEACYKRWLHL